MTTHLGGWKRAGGSGSVGIVRIAWRSSKPRLILHGEASSGRGAAVWGMDRAVSGGRRRKTSAAVIALLKTSLRWRRGEAVPGGGVAGVVAAARTFGTKSTESFESGSHQVRRRVVMDEIAANGRGCGSAAKGKTKEDYMYTERVL